MKAFFKKSRYRRKVFYETCKQTIPKTSLTRWNSWLEAVITHEKLYKHYEKLIENLNKANITSALIIGLKQIIKNPIIHQQIKFISTISKPIINAILCTQSQEIVN